MNEPIDKPIDKPILRLLLIIANWEKISKINEVFRHSPVHFCYLTKAEGAASSEVLEMFGFGHTDKALVLCIAPQPVARALLAKVSDALLFQKKGTGIGFTIPLSGVAVNIVRMLNERAREKLSDYMNKMESEVEKMKSETSMALILSVINQGYSEDLMEAAKRAGATGGTVIHARRLGFGELINFLGSPMQAEREIVFIITDREHKVEIMKAINQKCGLTSEAHGVTIALPVDGAAGL